jgi:hypothetical protein
MGPEPATFRIVAWWLKALQIMYSKPMSASSVPYIPGNWFGICGGQMDQRMARVNAVMNFRVP